MCKDLTIKSLTTFNLTFVTFIYQLSSIDIRCNTKLGYFK